MYDDELFSLRAPICSICNQPVPLNYAKTDEDGNAIHEACYLVKLGVTAPLTDPLKGPSVYVLKASSAKRQSRQ
jgi:hypothetical protein